MTALAHQLIPSGAARLPVTYEAAKAALARCDQVDECKEWADKAAAIAVYARQSRDDSLVILAQRIQARAIRRAGELLKEIPHVRGPGCGALGPTRTSTARAAGMSRLQQRQAAQIAQIPQEKFERLVEAKDPPRPYKLAAIGLRKRYPAGRPKGGAIGSLRRQVEKAEEVVREKEDELAAAKTTLNTLRARLASYVARAENKK